jgi:hypothetical protein
MADETAALIKHYTGVESIEIVRLDSPVPPERPATFLERPALSEDYQHQRLAEAIKLAFGGKLDDSTNLQDIGGASVQNGKKANAWTAVLIWSPIFRRATPREKTFISKIIGRATTPKRDSSGYPRDIAVIRARSVEQVAAAYGVSVHGAIFMKDAFKQLRDK